DIGEPPDALYSGFHPEVPGLTRYDTLFEGGLGKDNENETTGIYYSSHRRGDCLPPCGDRANCAKNLPARHARARAPDPREEPARRVPAEGAGTTRLRAWQKSVI